MSENTENTETEAEEAQLPAEHVEQLDESLFP